MGNVTLVESDFDRLWEGVNRGDALDTAYSVLKLLGPAAPTFRLSPRISSPRMRPFSSRI